MDDGKMSQKIVESINDMIYLLDERGVFIYASPKCYDVLAFDSNQLKGRSLEGLIHPNDIMRYRQLLNRLSSSENGKGRIECRLKQKDGTWRWYLSNIALLGDPDEKKLTYIVTAYDITYHKKTGNVLKERLKTYRGLLERCSEAIILVNLEDKKIIEANSRFLDMFGFNKSDLKHLNLSDIMPNPCMEKILNCIGQVNEAGDFQKIEEKWYSSDGKQMDVELAISLVRVNGNKIVQANIRDVTEIKHNRLSASLHEITMEIMRHSNLADVIKTIITKACQLCKGSGGFCFLINKDKAIIENIYSTGISDELDSVVLNIDEGIAGKVYRSGKELLLLDYATWKGRVLLKCFDKMGSTLGLPLKRTSGEIIGIIVVTHLNKIDRFNEEDIECLKDFMYAASILIDNTRLYEKLQRELSARKSAEKTLRQNEEQMQQAQKMEALGTLAGGIAHDFNNILTGIVGYVELSLEDAPRDSMMYQCLLEVLKLGARAKDLVSQILSFSRKTVSKYQRMDIEKVLRETIRMLRATFPSTITIKENYRYSSAVLYADPTEIQQLIMNLCINAEHAMRVKGGILNISLDKIVNGTCGDTCFDRLKPGNYVKISIEDTGCGMNKHTMERIFEPFFTTKGVQEGTGLGLSVVHGIVTRHKGVITVESEPEKGSIFDIYLPMAEDNLIS